ncbi:DUF7134 domain-containing protein [Kitasatospora acidiphila]
MARPTRSDALLALAVGVPVGGWSLLLLWLAAPRSWTLVLAPAAMVGLAALAWRRGAPPVSFAAVSVACGVQVVVLNGFLLLPSLLAFPLALYGYCAYGGRRAPLTGIAVGALGAAGTAAWAGVTRSRGCRCHR